MSSSNKRVICVDLDGTLSNDGYRQRLAPKKGSPIDMWSDYHGACAEDTPVAGTVAVLAALTSTFEIHIISGRWEQMRIETETWLSNHNIPYDVLRMYSMDDRPAKNYEYKVRYVDGLRSKGFEPVLFLENELHVADYIEECGKIPVLCVNPRYSAKTAA